jgi:hypothetical protein
MILQSAVSLLNLASYRLVPRPPAGAEGSTAEAEAGARPGAGQDLEQVRDSIDAVRGLLEILERRVPSELRPLRDALSQLQMAYAREVGAEDQRPAGGDSGGEPGGSAPQEPPGEQGKRGPGPAESSGRLWVPGR